MPSKHIHIVGSLPRSGTTLLTELMINCFDIDGHADHEHSILKEFPGSPRILCTKKPNDIKRVAFPLKVNPDLYVIYVLRDPRDSIASRSHGNNTLNKKIWGSLGLWQQHQACADQLAGHPRFITIRYEDLAQEPDKVQLYLHERLPFLTQAARFSEFHTLARPSDKTRAALGAPRPISTASIGNWRSRKPYIKAQLEKYGDISALLIRLGYETDDSWLRELDAVEADNSDEPEEKQSALDLWWRRNFTGPRRNLVYWISHRTPAGPCLSSIRHRLRNLWKSSR